MTAQGLKLGETVDRRQWLRFDLDRGAEIAVEAGGRRYKGRIADISLGGLRLTFKGAAPADPDMLLRHHSAGELQGRRIWGSQREIGVAFGSTEGELEHLLRCISLILNAEPAVSTPA